MNFEYFALKFVFSATKAALVHATTLIEIPLGDRSTLVNSVIFVPFSYYLAPSLIMGQNKIGVKCAARLELVGSRILSLSPSVRLRSLFSCPADVFASIWCRDARHVFNFMTANFHINPNNHNDNNHDDLMTHINNVKLKLENYMYVKCLLYNRGSVNPVEEWTATENDSTIICLSESACTITYTTFQNPYCIIIIRGHDAADDFFSKQEGKQEM